MISGASRRTAAWLAALVLAAGAGAARAADEWGLDALMHALAQVKSAHGTFVERKHLAILSAPLELSGTLAYTAPGRLEKRTLAPEPAAVIVDGDRLTIDDGGRAGRRTISLRDHPAVGAFVESIRGTLAGDRALLERLYEVRLEGGPRDWKLVLSPRAAAMRELVTEIRLGGSGDRVTSVEVLEANGDRSIMTITGTGASS